MSEQVTTKVNKVNLYLSLGVLILQQLLMLALGADAAAMVGVGLLTGFLCYYWLRYTFLLDQARNEGRA